MCCLRYGDEAQSLNTGCPRSARFALARGHAKVVDVDILRRLVRLDFEMVSSGWCPLTINSLAHDHEEWWLSDERQVSRCSPGERPTTCRETACA